MARHISVPKLTAVVLFVVGLLAIVVGGTMTRHAGTPATIGFGTGHPR
jgi:hypothetical protein